MFIFGLRSSLALLALVAACVAYGAAGLLDVPPLTGRIVDLSATLTNDELVRLDKRLREFEERKGSQIAVLMVPTTRPEAVEQYAIRVAEQWKLGRKKVDDGAILLIAKNDRTLRIEVGYGLEGVLNDATAKRIIEDIIVPRFKDGDFYGGIDAGVTAISRVIDGEPLPPPQVESNSEFGGLERLLPVVFVAALVLGSALRAAFGRLSGAVLTGGILGLAAWFVAGLAAAAIIAGIIGFFLTLMGGRMGMLGWYGGHGRPRGDRGGWGGGFRGGGGGFGGGGASGRW